MKAVILAGGRGTRLAEETSVRPKPMVEIGGLPMLVHIMDGYARHGIADFVVACGYKGDVIKSWFRDFSLASGDLEIDLASGRVDAVAANARDWRVSLVDTGLDTFTGGRLKRLAPRLCDGTFLATYGDGLADVDIARLVQFHRAHGRLATVTAVHPPARFGALDLDGDRVTDFAEKVQAREGWINGGFFVFEPAVLDRIGGDGSSLEHDLLATLTAEGELMAYRHEGFWHPVDTLRDKLALQALWESGQAPWAQGR
jgi:glucose-1-phosphate cytidylyltransferase